MRGTVAKRLRRLAEVMTVGLDAGHTHKFCQGLKRVYISRPRSAVMLRGKRRR